MAPPAEPTTPDNDDKYDLEPAAVAAERAWIDILADPWHEQADSIRAQAPVLARALDRLAQRTEWPKRPETDHPVAWTSPTSHGVRVTVSQNADGTWPHRPDVERVWWDSHPDHTNSPPQGKNGDVWSTGTVFYGRPW